MYSSVQLGLKYVSYYFHAANGKGHGIHSPFVYHFINKVLNDQEEYPAYKDIEALRQKMKADGTVIKVEDHGAGSFQTSKRERSVASIAKNAVKPKKYGQLLYRMVKEYQPGTILELGTSLGITTSYLSKANPQASVVSLEGAAEVVAIARQNFNELGLKNITVVNGHFDEILPGVISKVPSVDFVFIDGNHRQEPSENYFKTLLPHTHNDSILIFDDIHWSREMEAAWNNIRNHEAVRCSIDLFFIGIVLFRKEFFEKQHFSIRF